MEPGWCKGLVSLFSNLPMMISEQGVSQHLNRMQHLQSGQVANLHPASFAIGKYDFGLQTADGFCQIFPNFLRDVIFFFLESERATQTAAICLNVVNRQTRNEPEDLESGEANSKRPEMAGCKVGYPCRKLLESGLEGTCLPQISKELKEIEEMGSYFIRSRDV